MANDDAKTKPKEETSIGQKVGYCKPPADHQFKKGVSGNPRGRPPKQESAVGQTMFEVDAIVLQEARRPITFTENGRKKTMPLIQLSMRQIAARAAKGDVRAQIALQKMTSESERRSVERKHSLLNRFSLLRELGRVEIRRRQEMGESGDTMVPHPEEIVLDSRTGRILINGPHDEKEAKEWNIMHNDLETKLAELEILEREVPGTDAYCEAYERLIEGRKLWIQCIRQFFPDQQTRRAPGFDLVAQRQDQSLGKQYVKEASIYKLAEKDFFDRLKALPVSKPRKRKRPPAEKVAPCNAETGGCNAVFNNARTSEKRFRAEEFERAGGESVEAAEDNFDLVDNKFGNEAT